MKYLILSLLVSLPFVTSAQGLQQYIPTILTFINASVIPFLLGIAFLVVVINLVRYFVVESTSEDGRTKAKAYLFYSILAFALILVFWGIITLLINMIGLGGAAPINPDIPGYPG